MPDDCFNHLMIVCHDSKQITNLHYNELNKKFVDINSIHKTELGIIVNIWTTNYPDYEWLDQLVENYPECWIKNIWENDSGTAGVFTAGKLLGEKCQRQSVQWGDLTLEGKYFYFGEV